MSGKGLVPREQAILAEIIQYYFAHHEAVSARTLSKISELSLSPTTIRNLMEDLSEAGYLTPRGGTRGRIPTQKAFYIYISGLPRQLRKTPPPLAEQRAEHWERTAEAVAPAGLDDLLEQLGLLLAQQTDYAAAAYLPPREQYPLDWLRFAVLDQQRVLVSVGTPFGDVWSRVLPAAEPIPEPILQDVEHYLTRHFRHRSFATVRAGIMTGEAKELLEEASSLGAAFRLLRKAFEWGKAPQWRVWGEDNLHSCPDFQQPDQAARLYRALRDAHFLPRAAEQGRHIHGALVAIGSETGLAELDNLSLVARAFGTAAPWRGYIALIGPLHMDYGQLLQVVDWAAAELSAHVNAAPGQPAAAIPR